MSVVLHTGDHVAVHLEPAAGSVAELYTGDDDVLFTYVVGVVPNLSATQVETGNDASGTTKITLAFTLPSGAASGEVWRKGYGNYPLYDNAPGSGSVPVLPGLYPPAGWTLTGVTASGQTDQPSTRNVWYYVAYARDSSGNVSPVSNMTAGTLNYHLGDVSDGVTSGQGDNQVSTADLSVLGPRYGSSGAAIAGYEYLDVGPTTDRTTSGRPTTDSKIDFEDLMMIGLNYTPQVSLVVKARSATQAVDEIAVGGPKTVNTGDEFDVPVIMVHSGDLRGLSLTLDWDHAVAAPQPDEFTEGDLFSSQGPTEFLSAKPGNADVVGLSATGASGRHLVVTAHFHALSSGAPSLSIAQVIGRDSQNRDALVSVRTLAVETAVLATDLQPVIPNPTLGAVVLHYSLASRGAVDLSIYSVDGRRVRSLAHGTLEAGRYQADWNGMDDEGNPLRAGVYYVRLDAMGVRKSRIATLVR